ncbi:ycgM [Acrasis kona]|uniref:YcgM n=1 Tax=Acrasis kona TaxID=1008807 RepID=A0AAW2YSP5_9EUKA
MGISSSLYDHEIEYEHDRVEYDPIELKKFLMSRKEKYCTVNYDKFKRKSILQMSRDDIIKQGIDIEDANEIYRILQNTEQFEKGREGREKISRALGYLRVRRREYVLNFMNKRFEFRVDRQIQTINSKLGSFKQWNSLSDDCKMQYVMNLTNPESMLSSYLNIDHNTFDEMREQHLCIFPFDTIYNDLNMLSNNRNQIKNIHSYLEYNTKDGIYSKFAKIRVLLFEESETSLCDVLSPICNMMKLGTRSNKLTSAIVIGPFLIQWNEHGVIAPKIITGVGVACLHNTDLMTYRVNITLSEASNAIAHVLTEWNRRTLPDCSYSEKLVGNMNSFVEIITHDGGDDMFSCCELQHKLKQKMSKNSVHDGAKMNSQMLVEDILAAMNINPNPGESLRHFFNELYFNDHSLPVYYPKPNIVNHLNTQTQIIFRTHQQVYDLIDEVFTKLPGHYDLNSEELKLLLLFDLSFWASLPKQGQSKRGRFELHENPFHLRSIFDCPFFQKYNHRWNRTPVIPPSQ